MKQKLSIVLLLALASCSSDSHTDSNEPAWVKQPARTVDAGYIIYVGVGQDRSLQQATFKAESQALQDLANECSFLPKGARIEDRYDHTQGVLHQIYAKVAVDFQTCEDAQKAVNPDDIRKLANVALTDQLKRYQEDEDENEESLAEETQQLPNAPSSQPSGGGGGNAYAGGVRVAVVDEPSFFVVRQQVVYEKQEVITAPPGQYAPNTAQTNQFVNSVSSQQKQVQTYQTAHPEIRNTPHTYSGYHAAAQSRMSRGPNRSANQRGQGNRGQGSGQKKRRRRKNW